MLFEILYYVYNTLYTSEASNNICVPYPAVLHSLRGQRGQIRAQERGLGTEPVSEDGKGISHAV